MQIRIYPLFSGFFTCLIALTLYSLGNLMAKDTVSIETMGRASTLAELTASKKATLGAGCFWCVEAVFESLEGVESVCCLWMICI